MACCQQRFSKTDPQQNIDPVYFRLAYFACSDLFEVWVKKTKKAKNTNGNTERNPQCWQKRCWSSSCSLTICTFQQSLARRDLIQGFAWRIEQWLCHIPPHHHISTSNQVVKGIFSGNFNIQYTNFAGNTFIENWLHHLAQEPLGDLCDSSFHVITFGSQLEHHG